MVSKYRNNHYVPIWYQKRFLLPDQRENVLYRLKLKPAKFEDPKGNFHSEKAVRRKSLRDCFMEEDLYTLDFGDISSTKVEEQFFGEIDRKGRLAVEYFSNFKHPSINNEAFNSLLMYMSTQKLRTPKGLDWLSSQVPQADKTKLLSFMMYIRNIHCALWTECIWQIADAENSATKFIISDHPVTVYNRRCGPRSQWCREANDPDIAFNATHTIFPLSIDRILILTNLSWVRNPYQSEVKVRPNPSRFRGALFKYSDIQILRHLTEKEVREINFIIKSRAYRFLAAAKEEWLYPDYFVSKSQWNTYGEGYLLMPDPRSVHSGGDVIIGHNDGSVTRIDEYGRGPWDPDFTKESNSREEFNTLLRFQGEFATKYGPFRRGRSFEIGKLDSERDSDEFHQYHLNLWKNRKKIRHKKTKKKVA